MAPSPRSLSQSAGVQFRFQDKNGFNLERGQTASIRIWIDGDGYKGTATAINDSEYQTSDLSTEFLKELIAGNSARVELDGSKWTLKLRGLKESLGDAWRYYDRRC